MTDDVSNAARQPGWQRQNEKQRLFFCSVREDQQFRPVGRDVTNLNLLERCGYRGHFSAGGRNFRNRPAGFLGGDKVQARTVRDQWRKLPFVVTRKLCVAENLRCGKRRAQQNASATATMITT